MPKVSIPTRCFKWWNKTCRPFRYCRWYYFSPLDTSLPKARFGKAPPFRNRKADWYLLRLSESWCQMAVYSRPCALLRKIVDQLWIKSCICLFSHQPSTFYASVSIERWAFFPFFATSQLSDFPQPMCFTVWTVESDMYFIFNKYMVSCLFRLATLPVHTMMNSCNTTHHRRFLTPITALLRKQKK